MKRPYCPELDDPFQVFDWFDGKFFVARSRYNVIGRVFDSREEAEKERDRIQAYCDLHTRLNDALDWAHDNEGVLVTSEEITHAVWRTPNCMGLLAFESRKADAQSLSKPVR